MQATRPSARSRKVEKSISTHDNEPADEEQNLFEIEIVDLDDTIQPGDKKITPAQQRGRPLFNFPFMRNRRLKWRVMAIGVYAFAIILLLASFTPTRTVLDNVFVALLPPALRPLSPGSDRFFIRGTPAWGQLSIDGQIQKDLPLSGTDDPLQLAKGEHRLTWTAAPAGTQNCTLSVPPDKQDGCWANLSQGPWHTKGSSTTVWYIAFTSVFPALFHFAGNVRQEITSSIQINLDASASTAIVQPGDLYALHAHTVIAQQPLQARLHFMLDIQGDSTQDCVVIQQVISGCILHGFNCRTLCDPTLLDPTFNPNLPDTMLCQLNCNSSTVTNQTWDVLAVVRAVWDYTTPDGQIVALNQPDYSLDTIPAKAPPLLQDEHVMLVQLSQKNGHWQSQVDLQGVVNMSERAADSSLDPVCAAAWSEKSIRPELTNVSVPHQGDTIQWQFISGPTEAEGCLAYVSVVMTSDQPAYLLHRFGVFLTANLVARLIWPTLPVMRASLKTTVNQLVTILPHAERISATSA